MSEARVVVDFRLVGPGRADCNLRVGGQTYLLDYLSYTTDALGDLLRFALMIASGAAQATVSFDHEPAELRLWAYNLGGRGGLFLKVLQFDDIYGKQSDEAGHIVFATECDADDFARAVLAAGKRVWEELGAEGYVWLDYKFPLRALRALEAALSVEDPPQPPYQRGTTIAHKLTPKED